MSDRGLSNICDHKDGKRRSPASMANQRFDQQEHFSCIHPRWRVSGVKGRRQGHKSWVNFDKTGWREISRGNAEADTQIRSSKELGDERSCETKSQFLAKAKTDLGSPESFQHSEGSPRTFLGRVVTLRKRPEFCTSRLQRCFLSSTKSASRNP